MDDRGEENVDLEGTDYEAPVSLELAATMY